MVFSINFSSNELNKAPYAEFNTCFNYCEISSVVASQPLGEKARLHSESTFTPDRDNLNRLFHAATSQADLELVCERA